MKRYRMRIQILSPVHIGSGREIDPLEYAVVNLEDGRTCFVMLDIGRFLQELPARLRRDFDSAVNSPNPVPLRNFLVRNVDWRTYGLFSCAATDDFVRAYKDNFKNPLNQLRINLMVRRGGDYRPILPGSSVKGAIRTAVVSELAAASKPRFGSPRGFENAVLGYRDAGQDPFRCIKIADATLVENATFIDSVRIFKPDARFGPDPAGIQMFYEQCYSLLDDEDVTATTCLAIDDQLADKDFSDGTSRRPVPAVSMKLTAERLAECCRKFYLPKMQAEHNNFYASGKELADTNRPLLEITFDDNEFPVRLGRFSHIECVTADTYRSPGGAAGRRGWGKTRTLSGGYMAMGWAKVTLEPLR